MRKYSTPREVLNAHITSEEFMNLVCNYAEKIPPQRGGDGMSDLDKENIFLRNTSTKNFFTLLMQMFDIHKTEEGNVFWVRLCYDMLDRDPFTIYQWKPLITFFEENDNLKNDILELEWRRWEDVLGDKIHKIYAFDITSAAKMLHEWSTSTLKDKHNRLISYLIKHNEHPTTKSNIIYV